jgi:hypothetical protein
MSSFSENTGGGASANTSRRRNPLRDNWLKLNARHATRPRKGAQGYESRNSLKSNELETTPLRRKTKNATP